MSPTHTVYDDQPELDLGLPLRPRLTWPLPGELEPRALPAGQLDGFTTSVFVQAYTSDYLIVRRLVEHTGVGAVLTLRSGRQSRCMRAVGPVTELHRHTRTPNVLVDASEYSGKNRKFAGAGIDLEWNRHQHKELALAWSLTNSGYAASLADARRLLRDGAAVPGKSITALPIPSTLLGDHATELADEAREQGHPVALLLEDKGDPFDDPNVLHGLSHVVANANNPVLLLRTDVSALGAISHGAVVGAVGGAGQRHIYPQGGDGFMAPLAFVIPELLGYYLQTRFLKAYLRDTNHHAWSCPCWFCAGRDLTWIGNQPPVLVPRAALQHSVAALAEIAETLALAPDPRAAWTRMCATAEALHVEIANPSGSPWEPKAALTNWRSLTPVTVSA